MKQFFKLTQTTIIFSEVREGGIIQLLILLKQTFPKGTRGAVIYEYYIYYEDIAPW